MVQVNFWFIPRSRSTALLRCLANIPGSKVLFEKFIWGYVAEKAPGLLAMLGIDPKSVPTNEELLQQLQKDPSPIKIIKVRDRKSDWSILDNPQPPTPTI